MKGYFSKLIQQTGITFVPSGRSRSTSIEQTSLKQRGRNAMTPFHFKEDGLTNSEQGRVGETANDGNAEDSEGSYHISEHLAVHQPIEEQYETKIVQDRQSQMSGSQKSGLRAEMREQIKQKYNEMDLQLTSTERRQKSLVTSDLIREGEGMINFNKGTKDDHVGSGEGLFTLGHQSKDGIAFKQEIMPNDKISQALSQQTYLKQVREWVAATSDVTDLELTDGKISKVGDSKRENVDNLDENRGYPANYYGFKESEKNNELEVNDFYLSIGTISLTIEEPRNEVQSKTPPPIKVDQGKRQLESESSRLNRHYIRIR